MFLKIVCLSFYFQNICLSPKARKTFNIFTRERLKFLLIELTLRGNEAAFLYVTLKHKDKNHFGYVPVYKIDFNASLTVLESKG